MIGKTNILGGGTPYTGDNPLVIGEENITIESNTLLKESLVIQNGIEKGSKVVTGTFEVTSKSPLNTLTINHNLGVEPKIFMFMLTKVTGTNSIGTSGGGRLTVFACYMDGTVHRPFYEKSEYTIYWYANPGTITCSVNSSSITFNTEITQSYYKYGIPAGQYKWVAII